MHELGPFSNDSSLHSNRLGQTNHMWRIVKDVTTQSWTCANVVLEPPSLRALQNRSVPAGFISSAFGSRGFTWANPVQWYVFLMPECLRMHLHLRLFQVRSLFYIRLVEHSQHVKLPLQYRAPLCIRTTCFLAVQLSMHVLLIFRIRSVNILTNSGKKKKWSNISLFRFSFEKNSMTFLSPNM